MKLDQPKPVYSYGGETKKQTKILDSSNKAKNQRMTRKAKGKPSYARPIFFSNHICNNESNCTICKNYINSLRRKK